MADAELIFNRVGTTEKWSIYYMVIDGKMLMYLWVMQVKQVVKVANNIQAIALLQQ